MGETNGFVWCAYRRWSFEVLEGLIGLNNARCVAILTTEDCSHDLVKFEALGIQVFREDPRAALISGSRFLRYINNCGPVCCFFYGWSWIIPNSFHGRFFSVTYHPGRLPDDRGGSPLQNQMRRNRRATTGNIMRIADGIDTGEIYKSSEISLVGEIEDVWVRMTSSALADTLAFLEDIENNRLVGRKQEGQGVEYKRVKSGEEQIKPSYQTATQALNIIRAHNETDPNSYVKKPFIKVGNVKLVINKAGLKKRKVQDCMVLSGLDVDCAHEVASQIAAVNNMQGCFQVPCLGDTVLYIYSARVALMEEPYGT